MIYEIKSTANSCIALWFQKRGQQFIGTHDETLFRPFDRVGGLVAVGAAVCGAVAVAVDVADAVAGAVGRGVAVAVAVIVAVARSRARSNCADG
jgi:hypothetical protein